MINEIRRNELIEARKRAGLTQQDVAYMVGVSASMYQRFEGGYNDPKPEVAERITDKLNLPKNYFDRPEKT